MTRSIDTDGVPQCHDVAVPDWIQRRSGRPSLTAPGTVSPRVSFRLNPKMRDQAARIAKRQDKSLSRFAREALEARVEHCLFEEAIRKAMLSAMLQRRGPGILDRPIEEYDEDVEGW
jgi:predicted transcriptional regulator